MIPVNEIPTQGFTFLYYLCHSQEMQIWMRPQVLSLPSFPNQATSTKSPIIPESDHKC